MVLTGTPLTHPERAYAAFAGLNGAVALLLGAANLSDFPGALASVGMTYTDDLALLGVLVGMQFVLQAVVLFLAVAWTVRRNSAGPQIGYAVGGYLTAFTALVALTDDPTAVLIADLPRGLLLVGLAALAARAARRAG